MRIPPASSRAVAAFSAALATVLTVSPLRSQPRTASRVWATATSGWPFPTEQSAHEIHPGPGPRIWRVTMHPRSVNWYRVQAAAAGAAPITAQLTAAGRPLQGPRLLNNAAGYATDWIVCTSAANAPLVLEVQASGTAEWAFGLWVPPVTIPIGPCP